MSLIDDLLGILTPPAPITGDFNHVVGTASLQELVYFGAAWPGLDVFGAGIEQRNGWTNAFVYRTDTADLSLTGGYYAGQIERVDAAGKVTDVVLSFQGMQVDATVLAAVPSAMLGLPALHFARGIEIFDALMHDPRYADAKIHVTGYSMGTINAAWVLAHSLATYGETITDQRADFTSFAPARYHDEQMMWYGLDASYFDGRWTNYQAANDENRNPDHDFVGTEVILPALNTPTGTTDVHQWNHVAIALGLPDWLTSAEQHFVFQTAGVVSAEGYTTPGLAPLIIEGDDAGTALRGLGANDIIAGGLGKDVMTGAGGIDVFRYDTYQDSGYTADTADVITDFVKGEKIDMSALDANVLPNVWGQNPNDAFTYIGGANFTAPGQIRSWKSSGTTWVAANNDLDSVPELMIALSGSVTLAASDFIA